MQLDEGKRGFSFKRSGPLDMRMDPSSPISAEDVVNDFPEKDLGEMFKNFGEERMWRRGAKAICRAREKMRITTTKELADIISRAFAGKGERKAHRATKIFQAIRIYVNDEMKTLESSIKTAIERLAPEGRCAVLSYHSLEDRIVKNVFRAASQPLQNVHGMTVNPPVLKMLKKKIIVPKFGESRRNRRSRSAKMRAVVKL